MSVFLATALVGQVLYPSVHILMQRAVPGLLKHVFIHEGVAVETFQS